MRLLLLTFIFMAVPSFGVGTVSCSTVSNFSGQGPRGGLKSVKITCTATADDSDGSYPSTSIDTNGVYGWIIRVDTNPGSPAPTDNWDFDIQNDQGMDVLNALGDDRDTSTTEAFAPIWGNTPAAAHGTANLVIVGNSVNSAVIVFDIYVNYF